MSRPSRSPAGVFVFLFVRTARNRTLRLLQRLKEPRYGIGFALGLLYFVWVFGRRGRGRGLASRGLSNVSPEALTLMLLAASAILAAVVLIAWIFRRGRADLFLSEAEAQFLFAAPLPRRSVLHYALLRPQAMLLFSSFVMAFFFRRGSLPGRFEALLGTWVLLSTLRFHWLGLSFAKASWMERKGVSRFWRDTTLVVAAGLLILLLYSVADGARIALDLLDAKRGATARELLEVISKRRLAGISSALLFPLQILLAPLFASDAPSFWARLPLALALLAANYFWALRTTARHEEATLEAAARRAQWRARRAEGRPFLPSSQRRRHIVPFPLSPHGRPEIALVWKNFLCWQRLRLRQFIMGVLALALLLFLAARILFSAQQDWTPVALVLAGIVAFMGAMVGILLPIGPRFDLRHDMENMELLRVWPLTAPRLVVAELATSWLLSILFFASGLVLSLGILAGALGGELLAFSGKRIGGSTTWTGFPLLLAILWLVPTLSAFVGVLQNGLALSFPAWFSPKVKRLTSFERMGTGILTMLVTGVLLLIVAVPCALLAAVLWFVLGRILGGWIVPLITVVASAPIWGAVVLGVRLLARLFERFDPALELTA